MRLLECRDSGVKLTEDLLHGIPAYAILSHTWGPNNEEVTFGDLINKTGEDKAGYEKIRFCANQARRDGLQYFWVDTCCIDKSNNNELSTAINSMFRWYRNATRCYVFLTGIRSDTDQNSQRFTPHCELAFRQHKWFTRGWTLQELLAPTSVEFFDQNGQRLGDKRSLEQKIHEITGISIAALHDRDLSRFAIEERFRWAEMRQTTREEDWAYCLLGIFGVFMPLIYGEGKENALRRLKREIAETRLINAPFPSSLGNAVPEENTAVGLTVLSEADVPTLDIIFIHGFSGHAESTWTSWTPNARRHAASLSGTESFGPPSKVRRLNSISLSHSTDRIVNSAVCWPRDLVPQTFPHARILTFGYDTSLKYSSPGLANHTVYDIAWDFLVALEAERRTESTRPILFVAHSLGGIVVEAMLQRSRDCDIGQPHLFEISQSTTGIIFFGTPHNVLDTPGFLQHVAEKVARSAGVTASKHVINALLPDSARLSKLESEFSELAQEQNWIIHSFQELYGSEALFGEKVVEDVSSHLGIPQIETAEHIGRNHMEICHFEGPDDIEYKKVAAALSRFTTRLSRKPLTREPSVSAEQKRVLLDSLFFDQLDSRQKNIKIAYGKTCKWLLGKPEYLDWLDSSRLSKHHGLLWIKGKPGSGKSTIMKFNLANAQKMMKDTIILSFFFNARGSDLEKSVIGTYRSLLWQLLKQRPALQDVFESLELATRTSEVPQWTTESLKALFEQAVQSLKGSSLACFIDALDECDEDQIRDMVSFFERLSELTLSAGIWLRVCFSSRHYPHIISNGLDLTLEGQEGHSQDIISYLNSELKIGRGGLAEELRGDILQKASGVFMWVVLVVGILNKEYAGGRIHTLQQRLRTIPGDLHELFRDILTRDGHNEDEMLLCIQWVLFAQQPLKPEQLYFAILAGADPPVLFEWNPDVVTPTVMRRFILDSSKGLAEVTRSKSPTVQFIHESVKDYLLKDNGLKEIWSSLEGNFQGESQNRLRKCCLNYLGIDIATCVGTGERLPTAFTTEAKALRELVNRKFPFLEYATGSILYHADAAEESGISQSDFVQSFQLAEWIQLNNLFETRQVRRYSQKASLLYILSEKNLPALIKSQLPKHSCFDEEDERHGPPVFAALASRSNKAIASFAHFYSKLQPRGSPLHELCTQFSEKGNSFSKIGRQFTFSQKRSVFSYVLEQDSEQFLGLFVASGEMDTRDNFGRNALSHAAQRGYKTLVDALVATEGMDIELRDVFGRTALSWSADNGQEAVIHTLLDRGAYVDSKDSSGQTPLWWATMNGHEAAARLLCEHGADIELKDRFSSTPLLWTAQKGKESMMRLLIEQGADSNSKDDLDRTPLSHAVEGGHISVIRLLLEQGVNIETKDNNGQTPLSWASLRCDETAIRLLIKQGADIESMDNFGRSPLSWAAMSGHEIMIRLLLEQGANINSKDNFDQTPLLWSVQKGHEGTAELLVMKGADIQSNSRLGQLLLLLAIDRGFETIVHLLLNKVASFDATDRFPYNPFTCAAAVGHEDVLRLLLKSGIDINLRNESGQTALLDAVANGQEAVTSLLLDNGADVDSTDDSGLTPLLHAVMGKAPKDHTLQDYQLQLMLLEDQNYKRRLMISREKDDRVSPILHTFLQSKRKQSGPVPGLIDVVAQMMIIRMLLAKGANIESRDRAWSRTPLLWAVVRGYEDIVRLLLEKGADTEVEDKSGRTPLQFASESGQHTIVTLLESYRVKRS